MGGSRRYGGLRRQSNRKLRVDREAPDRGPDRLVRVFCIARIRPSGLYARSRRAVLPLRFRRDRPAPRANQKRAATPAALGDAKNATLGALDFGAVSHNVTPAPAITMPPTRATVDTVRIEL